MLVDSHAHLEMDDFKKDIDHVIKRAEKSGIDYIVTVGTTLNDCRKAVSIAARNKNIYASIGIHPHEVKDIESKTFDSIKELAKEDKVVAFGEIGLDFFRNLSPRDIQIRRFGEQLDIAFELGLPIVIHDREAHDEVLDMLKGWKGKRGVFHCFSGDYKMAKKCIDMGFYISVPGAVTFPKSEKLQEVVRRIPSDSLLIETDAPYLTPHPFRGKRNEPSYLTYTAQKVAQIKGMSFEELAMATTKNAKAFFSIS